MLFLLLASRPVVADTINLQGSWRFELDPGDTGVEQQWQSRELPKRIALPGVLQAQGYGNPISTDTPWVLSLYDRLWFLRSDYQAFTNAGSVKVPFLCQPLKHYLGAAWYQRDLEIPESWRGRRLALHLERVRWESRVWLDDRLVGTNNSLCAPHEFELGLASPGKHRLTIRLDNRMMLPYRPDAHAVSDSLGSTWNGIVGKIELRSTSPVWMDDAKVFADAGSNVVRLKVVIGNVSGNAGTGELKLLTTTPLDHGLTAIPVRWEAKGGTFETVIPGAWNPARQWDEFHSQLQTLKLRLSGSGADDEREITWGLRTFKANGRRFTINGRETFLRGTHHGGDFPLTGYPPTEVDYWRRLMGICKDWGLNHVRFHSFCPPEAAFVAADEAGIYLAVEPGMWNTFNPGTPMEAMLYLETERMLRAYGNHASFVMLSPSNEPKGRWQQVLPAWAEHFRKMDPRRVYANGTGFTDADAPGSLDKVDYTVTQRIGAKRVRGEPGWFGRDYSSSLQGVSVPVVGHENGQWCAYPDYGVIGKFTGYLRPGNYEIFRESLAAHGMLHRNADFTRASGRLQLACYKEEVEASLRTPELAGFQLLDLHDYIGQGTALVGLLDPFWETKGYAQPAEFRRFCQPTVPLARFGYPVLLGSNVFQARVEVAHFGPDPLTDAIGQWRVEGAGGRVLARGVWPAKTIPIGSGFVLGDAVADVTELPAQACRLVVSVSCTNPATAMPVQNDWQFWVFPDSPAEAAPGDVLVTRTWSEAQARLAEGGRVLFLPRNADLDWTSPPLDRVPIFWNRLMNPGWSRMLGMWCDRNHPALARFPTDFHYDWQWAEIVQGVRAINLDRLPAGLQPIVQPIDDWNRNWKLGALFECRVGPGKLVVSAFDLETDLARRAVARQLRTSLLSYMTSEAFAPRIEVTPAEFGGVLFDTRIMRKLGAEAKGEGANLNAVIDGDPNSAWVAGGTGRNASGSKHPHVLTISFPKPIQTSGLVIMPRQNDRDHLGDVREYRVEASENGREWRAVCQGTLPSSWNPQRIAFPGEITAGQLRFTALSGYGADTSVGIADLAVIYSGPPLKEAPAETLQYRRSRSTSSDVDEQ